MKRAADLFHGSEKRSAAIFSRCLHFPVVVAVIAVRVVQMAADQVVGVVAMRDSFVAAAGAVLVGCVVAAAIVLRGAARGIDAADFELMLFDCRVLVVQMAVVQVIDVAIVFDAGVAALGAVLMCVVAVMLCHGHSPLLCVRTPDRLVLE